MEKVLIIVYYWPPSGGAGVQRWLKLSKYLAESGVITHVLTVDPEYASYIQRDESLINDVSEKVTVHTTKSFEPINMFASVAGKKSVPTAGFANIKKLSFKQKAVNFMRSNLFIPDPRKGWNKYAYRKAKEVIEKEGINTVIVSSPPHSHQLIGMKLKKKLGITWVADMRDPWTDIYYYKLLQHSVLSRRIDKKLEKSVLEKADKVLTVGKSLVDLFASKSETIDRKKFTVIPNGYDPEDFESDNKHRSTSDDQFTISYTGTMSDQYDPEVFFNVLEGVDNVSLQLIGRCSGKVLELANSEKLKAKVKLIDPVPHADSVAYLKGSDALLLIIPNIANAKGILTGKLFEYLASGKPIICIGPREGDAAQIIHECGAGRTFERGDRQGIQQYIEQLKKEDLPKRNIGAIEKHSRKAQAAFLKDQL